MGYLEQSTLARRPAAAGLELSTELIVWMPFDGLAEYRGTRAAIEAEGLIPGTTRWPNGFDSLHWEDGEYSYWLRRQRPEGVKGPRNKLLDMDYWAFRFTPLRGKCFADLNLERKARELAELIQKRSRSGQAEIQAAFDRWLEAERDVRFQAIKNRIPGVTRQKRKQPEKEKDPPPAVV